MIVTSGLGGIQTCDMEVDGNGIAVDCSKWSNFFNATCWNPIAPCAASGAVEGQQASVDNSLSQLGPTVAGVLEGGGAAGGGLMIGGISVVTIILVVAGIAVAKVIL